MNYKNFITEKYSASKLSTHLKYDDEGYLWLNQVCLQDLINKYGTPLEIDNTNLLQEKGDLLKEIVRKIADEENYKGGFKFCYATKANMQSWCLTKAYEAGWDLETSSNQDLINISALLDQGALGDNVSIICNGVKKLETLDHVKHKVNEPLRSKQLVFKDEVVSDAESQTEQYSQNILNLHKRGIHILPILDEGELDFFCNQSFDHAMSVGLRLKYGKVSSSDELDVYLSRHGLSWQQTLKSAEKISKKNHLQLEMLHAMPGVSADAMSEEKFAHSLRVATDYYFKLKSKFPSLKSLNIGGGLPPTLRNFKYEVFLRIFLKEVKEAGHKYQLEVPTISFELGTYLVDESCLYIYKVIQKKVNHKQKNNEQKKWAIIDSSLMIDLPDSWITNKNFFVLAANEGNNGMESVILGDITCDSDGYYPNAQSSSDSIVVPKTSKALYIVVAGVGAYQRLLTGQGGAHHCGVLEPKRLLISHQSDKTIVSLKFSQTNDNIKEILGYK